MYEYEIYNAAENLHSFVWGYNQKDMERLHPEIDWNVWTIIFVEYID